LVGVDLPVDDRSGFAVIDVETTGFVAEVERIIEVGVVVLDAAGVERTSFSTLVDPGCDPGPTHIHGITPAMLAGAPPTAEVLPYVAELLTGRVVVGHNVDRFDLTFLRAECRRTGGDRSVPGPVPTVDTLVVAQRHLGLQGRARLVDCCDHFGLTWDHHHSALGDAEVTASLFRCMLDTVDPAELDVVPLLAAARGTAWPGRSPLPPVTSVRIGSVTG
jgi:DNA polymerase-3 subunit epsilon